MKPLIMPFFPPHARWLGNNRMLLRGLLAAAVSARLLAVAILSLALPHATRAQTHSVSPTYLGFDRNDYPGDESLAMLRQIFSYTGYWLNAPPGSRTNNWQGKRELVESQGFGFLVLFNGRLYAELKNPSFAATLGKSDAAAAVASARREGFPAHTVIFLDQEQGGRMLPEQKAYLFAWVDGVVASGFLPGVYCSGMAAPEKGGISIITAEDIRQNAGNRKISYWVTNDACPPSPGCAFPRTPPSPVESGVNFADVWQFSQSPKRPDVAAACRNYDRDRNCYPPASSPRLHLDLSTANSNDPSHGRSR